ncbi:IPExxxVDY family protein [Aquimarina sp. W85]|uniref:IPExxxVDY family protein n=1 Tax=Aquimarina rhodophyticola TaxID=3342246 RepID=UPI00366E73EF
MAVQRLVLDTLAEDDYELIAIHCSLESYRLAFLLNKILDIKLYRKERDIQFKYDDVLAAYPFYQFYDEYLYTTYSFFANTFRHKMNTNDTMHSELFSSEQNHTTKYLIPELKNVDYFLKIESDSIQSSNKKLLMQIQHIMQIVTAYTVDYNTLKSKNNLIFD